MAKKKEGPKNEQSQNFQAVLATAIARNNATQVDELIRAELTTHGKVDENTLRIALQQAAKRGFEECTRVLLSHGAKTDTSGGKGSPALFWALCQPQTKGHPAVSHMLLEAGADVEWRDEKGRSIVQSVAWRGHTDALKLLLEKGKPNLNSVDADGRTILHNLAVDKRCRWGAEIVDLILARHIDLDKRDRRSRTALHWASATGKAKLVQQLLERDPLLRADVSPVNARGKTPLHLVCDSSLPNAVEIIQLLLSNGADPKMRSDGGWTVLHNAAVQSSAMVIETLLAASPSLLSARTLTNYTALHVAANVGNVEVVKCLLSHGAKINVKDRSHRTPLIHAAHGGHVAVCELLAPYNNLNMSHQALRACQGFDATIVDFRVGDRSVRDHTNVVQKRTVFETIYGKDENNKVKINTLVDGIPSRKGTQHSSKPTFRWIHLPANNLSWAEDLIAKAFIEAGCSDVDIEGFKAVEKAFDEQHRGIAVHSRFMRPSCKRCPRGSRRGASDDNNLQMFNPLESALRASAPREGGHRGGEGYDIASSPERPQRRRARNFAPHHAVNGIISQSSSEQPATPPLQPPPHLESIQEPTNEPPVVSDGQTGSPSPNKQPQPIPLNRTDTIDSSGNSRGRLTRTDTIESTGTVKGRRSKRTRGGSSLTNGDPRPLSRAGTLKEVKNNNSISQPTQGSYISFFMPYLHFETERKRRQMRKAIEATKGQLDLDPSPDAALVSAFLQSTTGLHLRRTLDQYYLKGILDTEKRDQDQVVGRYCRQRLPTSEWKLYMVDQLWMWILGPGLIITAFPQRWRQEKNDSLNVLDGIVEDINERTREVPVQNVYDLAMLISTRCSGAFDRHKPGDSDYQFLDIFENSIGNVKDKEINLFNNFYDASAKVHRWLSKTDRKQSTVDDFLDIGKETELLKEIKDIRDELNMIIMVLSDQKSTLPLLSDSISKDFFGNYSAMRDIKRRGEEAQAPIYGAMTRCREMINLAGQIEESLLSLLDLKQKQSNVFEARFSRDSADGTVKQGQILLIFTMTTIIFLPISFMASFFAIPLGNFPRNESGNVTIHLSYVLKYMLPIGVGISLFLIAVAFSVNPLALIFRKTSDFFTGKLRQVTRSHDSLYDSSMNLSFKQREEIFTLDEVAINSGVAHTDHGLTGVGYFGLARMSKDYRQSIDTPRSPNFDRASGRRSSDAVFRHRARKEMEAV